jgi:hypothetical protein
MRDEHLTSYSPKCANVWLRCSESTEKTVYQTRLLAIRGLWRFSVTTHPTAEWVARQITEAFPWNEAPHYMIRDRDRIYGAVVTRRLRAHPGQAHCNSLTLAEWLC